MANHNIDPSVLNKIHHDNFLNNNLPEKSVNMILADPPYFQVKGDFDFIWNSFEDYLKDVEKWAIECKRLLADNGTLFWYGHAKKNSIRANYFR
jgi:DNA modification methylase